MPFLNGFSRHKFPSLLIILTALAIMLAACGDASPTTVINTPPATSVAVSVVSPNVGTTATPPASRTSSIVQATTSVTTSAATTSADTTAADTTALCKQDAPCQPTLTTAPAIITKANGEKINMSIELARTDQEQATGMMGRLSAPDGTGMLFIFPNTGRIAFWMENTPLPLSIAFITQDGKIINIQDMAPNSLDNHAPDQDYLFALEVAKGYFAKKGIAAGDTFSYQG